MKALVYTLHLESPVLATDIEGDSNSAVSLPYMPGSLLRGALVARYLQRSSGDLVNDPTGRALFLSGQTRFLNTYPGDDHGRRALPTPECLRYDKQEYLSGRTSSRTLHNLSVLGPGGLDPDFQDQPADALFLWPSESDANLVTPLRQVNVHTQRDARKGRATETAGAVYRYDALAADQTFQGAILVPDEHLDILQALLPTGTVLWLGRARRAGYGQVRVEDVRIVDPWHELSGDERPDPLHDLSSGERLQIVFTSDTLLRDGDGSPTLNPKHALESTLGVAVVYESSQTFISPHVVGGFNRKWGLPLPQAFALRMGSTFTCNVRDRVNTSALERLENDGLGERRGEGFGRVLVNRFLKEGYSARETLRPPTQRFAHALTLSDEEHVLAQGMAERVLRRRLDAALMAWVNDDGHKITITPSSSQLSRLRLAVRKALVALAAEGSNADDSTKPLHDFLNSVEERKTSRDQFTAARIAGHPLLTWIKESLEDRRAVTGWVPPVTLGGGTVTVGVDGRLALEYTLRLIDTVAHTAARSRER